MMSLEPQHYLQMRATATVRAFYPEFTGDILFHNKETCFLGERLYIHNLEDETNKEHLQLWRGELDKVVFTRIHTDKVLLHHYQPFSEADELYFFLCDLFGQIKASENYRGVLFNLKIFYRKMPIKKAETYGFMVLNQIFSKLIHDDLRVKLDSFYKVQNKLVQESIEFLKDCLINFEDYAKQARKICDLIYKKDEGEAGNSAQPEFMQSDILPLEKEDDIVATEFTQDESSEDEAITIDSLNLERGNEEGEGTHSGEQTSEINFDEQDFNSEDEYSPFYKDEYQVYTREFDKIQPIEKICEPQLLTQLRQDLDRACHEHHDLMKKLSVRLLSKIHAIANAKVRHSHFDGRINSKRLAQVIANPLEALPFEDNPPIFEKDLVLTLLIDNSGSMRGKPILTAAMSVDIIASALEKCGVHVEILGFTTGAWRGGNSKKLWEKNGCPPLPGRLNDLLHVIYKPALTPYRKARKNIAGMLKENLLKENIDGEALVWASSRLSGYQHNRKMLMVVSDGAPVDDASFSANDANILEKHLHHIIHRIEKKTMIELSAIGIGHDVKRYYKNAVTIRNQETLAGVIMCQFLELFVQD